MKNTHNFQESAPFLRLLSVTSMIYLLVTNLCWLPFGSGWLFSATKLVNPFFALLDAEVAHRLAVSAAARGWVPREKRPDPTILGLDVWGRKFSNPIGLAAGFDKNAEAVEGLLGLGFGFVEVGSVTPVPQEGNPKPRIFRLRQEGWVFFFFFLI